MKPVIQFLQPHLPLLLYLQIIVFALAILVGGFLLLRRLARKAPIETQILEEKEKLAAEIHEEILRLKELRDRLFEGGFDDANEPSVGPRIQQTVTKTEIRDNPELLKKNQELEKTIEALKKEMAALKASKVGATTLPDEAKESIRKEVETELRAKLEVEMGQKVTQQQATIQDLSNRLEEYEIFEDELAQIKKYKEENNRLKEQVTGTGASAEPFSEDDIAKLFSEMTSADGPQTKKAESVEAAPVETKVSAEEAAPVEELAATPLEEKKVEEAPAENVEQAGSPAQEVSTDDNLDKELEQLLGAEKIEPQTEVEEKASPPPGFEAENVADEPAVSVDTENAEAMAVLGADEDELMKEFEKVLGPKDKEGT